MDHSMNPKTMTFLEKTIKNIWDFKVSKSFLDKTPKVWSIIKESGKLGFTKIKKAVFSPVKTGKKKSLQNITSDKQLTSIQNAF